MKQLYIFLLVLLAACGTEQPQPMAFKAAMPADSIIGWKDTTVQIKATFKQAYTAYKDTTIVSSYTYSIPIYGQTTTPPPTGTEYAFTVAQREVASRPGAGFEQWHDQWRIPITGVTKPIDKYFRILASELYNADGSYRWNYFDAEVQDAINKGQKVSFGFMLCNPSANSSSRGIYNLNGGLVAYSPKLHQEEMSEAVKPGLISGKYVPNYNSESYFRELSARLNAVAQRISDKGWQKWINYIEIREYASYGEWHWAGIANTPPAQAATTANKKRIIDTYLKAFPNNQLVILFNVLDGNRLGNTMNATEVGYHALTVKNNVAPLGFRRDNWGALDDYIRRYTDLNDQSYNGQPLKPLIMDRWLIAPWVGEPNNQGDYSDLVTQINRLHTLSIGNGNVGSTGGNIPSQFNAAQKAMGYRTTITGGSFKGGTITVNWSNAGTPIYTPVSVWFELRANGVVKWSGRSTADIRLKRSTWNTVDSFTGLPAGEYELHIIVKDEVREIPLGITSSKVATVKI